ncbi:hypothetical protein V5O48_002189 [Marasmius crinis-equi]|uniref:Uncharacterized protein n=1 Tax=Marasmius crinis-equi TaxID=585013 RepID=A0ABR3FWE2_9AGAR
MPIRFTPSLGETVDIPIPVSNGDSDDTKINLKFTARLPIDEYRRLGFEEGKVQIWSNLGGSGGEQWGEADFALESEEEDAVLSHTFVLPIESEKEREYSFTYRILHPASGAVEWLGAFGQNGVVRVHPKPQERDDGMELVGDRWARARAEAEDSSASATLALDEEESSASTITIARLDSERWDVWAIGKDGYAQASPATTQTPLSIVLLVPKSTPKSETETNLPPYVQIETPRRKAVAFAVSPDAALTLTPSGTEILASGSGSGSVLATEAKDWDKLVLHATSSTSTPYPCHLVSETLVVFPTSPKSYPVLVSVVSLTGNETQGKAEVEVELASVVPVPQIQKYVLSRGKDEIEFLETGFVSLSLSPTPVSLSPIFNGIAILTPRIPLPLSLPSTSQTQSQQLQEALPTPPPSPQIRPIAHLSVQNVRRLAGGGGEGGRGLGNRFNDSMASISDIGHGGPGVGIGIGIPAVSKLGAGAGTTITRVEGEERSSEPQPQPEPQPREESVVPTTTNTNNKGREGRVMRRPSLMVCLFGCFQRVFFATSWFFVFLVRKVVLRGRGRVAGRVGLGVRPGRWGANAGREREREEEDERTPLLAQSGNDADEANVTPPPSPPAEQSPGASSASVSPPEQSPSPEPIHDESGASSPSPSPEPTPTPLIEATLLPSPTTNHKLVVQGAETPRIEAEVDGQSVAVDIVRVEKEAPGYALVELDWRKGGRLSLRVGSA